MSSLLDKLKSVSGSIKATTVAESSFFNTKEYIQTDVPIINVALAGQVDGGLTSGLGVVAGESKRFKSLLGLLMMKAYLDKYPDAIALFYDVEFGIMPPYLEMMGIDTSRVLHIPIEHIEQLKFDMAKRLDAINRGDRVFVFVDSVGMIASKKEAEDAVAGKDATDMTRAKQLKSVFRIITPHFTTKDICGVVINHVYKEQGSMYPRDVVSGGQGVMLAANWVWIIGKSQVKEGDEIAGWKFTINIEKSRLVKERSQLSFVVTYEGGVNKWSGLLDEALESGHIVSPSKGWYCKRGDEKKFRAASTNTKEFWEDLLADKSFTDAIEAKYKMKAPTLFDQADDEAIDGSD